LLKRKDAKTEKGEFKVSSNPNAAYNARCDTLSDGSVIFSYTDKNSKNIYF
jgi:hypothetical protein